MVNGAYWIAYDDTQSVALKARYVQGWLSKSTLVIGYEIFSCRYSLFEDLAGVMVWSIDQDDFRGLYSITNEPYPMMRSINEALQSGESYDPMSEATCGTANMCQLP